MGIRHAIDREAKVLFERWEGVITADEISAYWSRYVCDRAALACTRGFADVREAELRFSGSELKSLVEKYMVPLSDLEFRNAVLVARPVQMGIARQYEVFSHGSGEIRIFLDETDARSWLGLPLATDLWDRDFVELALPTGDATSSSALRSSR